MNEETNVEVATPFIPEEEITASEEVNEEQAPVTTSEETNG